MRTIATVFLSVSLLVLAQAGDFRPTPAHAVSAVHAATVTHAVDLAPADLTDVVQDYCVRCHNARRLTGNLSLEGFDVAGAPQRAEIGEKMILKLRAGMMPPPGARRPAGDTLRMLAETLRHLERDGLIWREVATTTPPAVRYGLTPLGRFLMPPLLALFAASNTASCTLSQRIPSTGKEGMSYAAPSL